MNSCYRDFVTRFDQVVLIILLNEYDKVCKYTKQYIVLSSIDEKVNNVSHGNLVGRMRREPVFGPHRANNRFYTEVI